MVHRAFLLVPLTHYGYSLIVPGMPLYATGTKYSRSAVHTGGTAGKIIGVECVPEDLTIIPRSGDYIGRC